MEAREPKIERFIRVRAARGLDILIVGKTELETAELGMMCKSVGYKPRPIQQTPSKREWFQWWYQPKKRQPKTDEHVSEPEMITTPDPANSDIQPTRWSARREGLVPMR